MTSFAGAVVSVWETVSMPPPLPINMPSKHPFANSQHASVHHTTNNFVEGGAILTAASLCR